MDYVYGRTTKKTYARMVRLHALHPRWTLDQLRGHGIKRFLCNLVLGFMTGRKAGFEGWGEASFELWAEGLVLNGKSVEDVGDRALWEPLCQDLENKLAEDEDMGFVFGLTMVRVPKGKRIGDVWGLEVEPIKRRGEDLNLDCKLYRTTGGQYEELKACRVNLRLTWTGSHLTIT